MKGRLSPSTIDLSTVSPTAAFTTPSRASVESMPSDFEVSSTAFRTSSPSTLQTATSSASAGQYECSTSRCRD